MLTPEQIKARLKDRVMTKVAEETGIYYHTLLRFRDGTTRRPQYETIRRLSEYLEKQESI